MAGPRFGRSLRSRSRDGADSRSLPHRIGSALLWWTLPALAATLVGGYVALALIRGVNPPVVPVEGISMRPLLHAGDLVLLRKPDISHLRKGDIIAFRTTSDVRKKWQVPGSYVHRIVTVEKGAYGYQFQTKGDNVGGKDPFWTVQRDVIGAYAGRIGGAGYPILFFRSKQGKILIGVSLLILALYALLGVLERRGEAQELNMLTLAGIVEEARGLKNAMDHAVTV